MRCSSTGGPAPSYLSFELDDRRARSRLKVAAALVVSVTILLTIMLVPTRGEALSCEADLGHHHVRLSSGGDLSGPRRMRDGKPSSGRAAGAWPRCRALSHIVFVAENAGWGTSTMRGKMLVAALNVQPAHTHGAMTAYFTEVWTLGWHIARHGRPTVCVMIKFARKGATDRCRAAGALIIWDLIDNPQSTNVEYLREHDFDAIAVLTDVHATLLAKQGVRAIVLPHSHGNILRWSRATSEPRPTIRGVGFVYGDDLSKPPPADLASLTAELCAVNVAFYLVQSANNKPLALHQQPCPNTRSATRRLAASHDGKYGLDSSCALASSSTNARRASAQTALTSCQTLERVQPEAAQLQPPELASPPDLGGSTSQRGYYESKELLEKIDVGLVWRPNRAEEFGITRSKVHDLAVANRDGTRMAWWWSHGLPVIGFPMNAYVQMAHHADYPGALVNLSTAQEVRGALCNIQAPATRHCLQQLALRGSELSSPQASALDFMHAMCELHKAKCSAAVQSRWLSFASPGGWQWHAVSQGP